ncbi:MAG: WXG100 family type VII secretion target [Chloroflexota bacterium]
MSDIIKVPYTELFHHAAVIHEQANIVESQVTLLSTTLAEIVWVGERRTRFFGQWENAKPQMNDWVKNLRAFADDLESQARRMQAADTMSPDL